MNIKIFNSTEDKKMRGGWWLFSLHYEAKADLLPSTAWVSSITDTCANSFPLLLDGRQAPPESTFWSPPRPQVLQPCPSPEPPGYHGGPVTLPWAGQAGSPPSDCAAGVPQAPAHPPTLSPGLLSASTSPTAGRPASSCRLPSSYQAWLPPRDFSVSEVIVHNYFFDKLGFHKGRAT